MMGIFVGKSPVSLWSSSTMKIIVVCFCFALVGIAEVLCGGYLTRGGVMDFGKHLDYMPMALHAGKMALFEKNADDLQSGRKVAGRHAKAYIPTFYTSRQNLAAQQSSSDFVYQQLRAVRDIDLPLFYPQYPYTK